MLCQSLGSVGRYYHNSLEVGGWISSSRTTLRTLRAGPSWLRSSAATFRDAHAVEVGIGQKRCRKRRLRQEKAAPFLGPHSQKRQVGKESGKAIQRANPPVGLAQREMSRTESEGHSSAASFIELGLKHLPRQRRRLSRARGAELQELAKATLTVRAGWRLGCRRAVTQREDCTILHIHCRGVFLPGAEGAPYPGL